MSPVFIPIFALLIPIVGIAYAGLNRWIHFKEKQLEAMGARTAESAAQYAARTERLEQRVAVLERLLTDRSAHLAEEIDRLREEPLN